VATSDADSWTPDGAAGRIWDCPEPSPALWSSDAVLRRELVPDAAVIVSPTSGNYVAISMIPKLPAVVGIVSGGCLGLLSTLAIGPSGAAGCFWARRELSPTSGSSAGVLRMGFLPDDDVEVFGPPAVAGIESVG